jgi:hypothetical protein
MLYFFQRGNDVLRCEVRPAMEGDGYEIAIYERNGKQRIEQHATSDQVHRRWLELHKQFEAEGWRGPVTHDGRG